MGELYVGLMSGTSLDGIDAVLVDMAKRPTALGAYHESYPQELRETLLGLSHRTSIDLDELARIDVTLGRLYADCVQALLTDCGIAPSRVRAVGSHGQTIRHRPAGSHPYTLQIGDPNIIAEVTGITTVADFRRRDMAAGGQGAPLVPAFHAALFRDTKRSCAVLNLGGIANVSLLPADAAAAVIGFDTGPGNVLLDSWSQRHLARPYDDHGRWAAGGTVIPALLERLLAEPYFDLAPPKSTGRELFNLPWLESHLAAGESAQDVQATLLELTAVSVKRAIIAHAPDTVELLVCGGGTRNTRLMTRLATHLAPIAVRSTADYGVDPQQMEAMAFAWLAQQTLNGRPGNLPTVTGARRPVVLGGIYPGR